jgi:hypothetical protein
VSTGIPSGLVVARAATGSFGTSEVNQVSDIYCGTLASTEGKSGGSLITRGEQRSAENC